MIVTGFPLATLFSSAARCALGIDAGRLCATAASSCLRAAAGICWSSFSVTTWPLLAFIRKTIEPAGAAPLRLA